MKEVNIDRNFLIVFQNQCKDKSNDPFDPCMSFKEFRKYQKKIQNDKKFSEIFMIQNLRKINPLHDIRKESISFYDFCYILQDNNPIL